MAINREVVWDLALDEEGDLILDSEGDLQTYNKNDLLVQIVEICLKTTNPDWPIENIGVDLEDLIGLDNTRETAEYGASKIKESLLKTGFLKEDEIWIEYKPSGYTSIVFFIYIKSPFDDRVFLYETEIDVTIGSSVRRVL